MTEKTQKTTLTKHTLDEMEKGKIAYKAIKKLIETLEMLNNRIKHTEHITDQWWTEYEAEGELYKALKNYEELIRKNEKKAENKEIGKQIFCNACGYEADYQFANQEHQPCPKCGEYDLTITYK